MLTHKVGMLTKVETFFLYKIGKPINKEVV